MCKWLIVKVRVLSEKKVGYNYGKYEGLGVGGGIKVVCEEY